MTEIRNIKHNDVEIIIYSLPDKIKVIIDKSDLETIFKIFNESNYSCINTIYIAPEFERICRKIFDVIKELIDKKDFALARILADYTFNQFTILWQYYMMHQRHILGTILWQHVCRITWDWETENNIEIHKGTPYFFLGTTQLMQGNIDSAFLFIYNAMEEDKRFSKQIDDKQGYKNFAAYLFSSLIVDNKNNYLYPYVLDGKYQIEKFIEKYNNTFPNNKFLYNDFDKKFLKNEDLEDTKYFFVYALFCIINQYKILRPELRNNDFSKLRNANIIFNLCLIIDEIMKNKIGGPNISGSIIEISKSNFGENNAKDIHNSLDFNDDFENAVNTCLSLNHSYNSKTVKKEVLTLILSWGLRNFGGHNIRSKQIFVDKYEDIIQFLLNTIFIILKELY